MAHKVNFNVPDWPLSHADVVFTIYENEEKFGELRVSKGAAVWFPGKKVIGYSSPNAYEAEHAPAQAA